MLDPEDEELSSSEAWRPYWSFDHDKLVSILARHVEIAAASRKGRKSAALVQMKIFNDRFHTVLNTPVPPNDVQLQDAQLSYVRPHSITAALQYQDAIVKEMQAAQKGSKTERQDLNPEDDIGKAVLHNLQREPRSA